MQMQLKIWKFCKSALTFCIKTLLTFNYTSII